jgi:hypothetical protein
VAGIVRRKDQRQLAAMSSPVTDVRVDGRGLRPLARRARRAAPRPGELRRGQAIPWRVIAARIVQRDRRGSR